MIASADSFASPSLNQLHARFRVLIPRIETHARIYFRGVRCPDQKEEYVAETLALAWKWFIRLAEKGKDASQFCTALARFAACAAKCGRRLAGHERAKDVMSPVAQRRHGFTVERLPASFRTAMEDLYSDPQGQEVLNSYEQRLVDNMVTPPPDAAAFRIDFPQWLSGWTDRDRRIIGDMSRDERTCDLARKFGVTPGRIAQLRRQYFDDWNRFHGEVADERKGQVAVAV